MNFDKITRVAGRLGLKARGAAPTIATIGGVAGGVAATILAVKATPSIKPAYDHFREELAKCKEVRAEVSVEEYTRQQYGQDLGHIYGEFIVEIGKTYGPAILLGTASIASILVGHGVMRRRNAALALTVEALNQALNVYRERVAELTNPEWERKVAFGEESGTETRVGEDGKEETIEVVNPDPALVQYSPYARIFDEASPEWKPSPEANRLTLSVQEQWFNDKLRARGHVFLNEVYDALGLPRTSAGCVVGWLYDDDKGDNVVDFGLFTGSRENREFINGRNLRPVLDFNVDGVIFDKIGA